MTFNTLTVTPEYPLWVETFDNKKVKLTVMIPQRDQVLPGMAAITFRRFAYGVAMLAGGIQWNAENEKMQEIEHRPDEWRVGAETLPEPRIAIWVKGQGIPVYTTSGTIWLPVNVFTELASVEDFVNMWQMVATERAELITIGEQQKPEQSELDKAFPPGRTVPTGSGAPPERTKPAPQQQRPTQLPGSTADSPYLGGYNYKLNEDYAAQYGGKTVRFDVMGMSRAFDSRDGSAQVQTFSSYNGSKSRYPAHSLKVKANRVEKLEDGMTRQVIESILNDGAEVNQEFYGSYYMFTPEPGKLYPLLVKLTPKSETAAPQAPAEKEKKGGYPAMDEPDEGMGYSGYDGDVPF